MIDKKEMIIDGVDVSKCEFYCEEYCTLSNDRNERLPFAEKCTGYSDCCYKQLARKEQECEELKKANDGILTTIRILAKNNLRLREIIAEMKDIAEANIRIADLEGLNGVYRRGLAKQILQKISEV